MAYNVSKLYIDTRDRIAAEIVDGRYGADWVAVAWKGLTAAERGMFRGKRDFEFSVQQRIRCGNNNPPAR